MSKLDDFILASEKRHNFLVSELQQSEQRTIDELTAEIDPLKDRMTKVESNVKWVDRWLVALSGGWAAIATWLFANHGGNTK